MRASPLLSVLLVLGACRAEPEAVARAPAPTPDPDPDPVPRVADPGETGPSEVTVEEPGRLPVLDGACEIAFRRYRPTSPASDTTVVLAHGFQRSIATMDLAARHYASWGLPVVTVSLCSNSLLGVDHSLNGRAMAAAGLELAPDARLYAGFSAGGLAAYLASAEDPEGLGFVGLDPVDAGAAVERAPEVASPAWAIMAGPQGCNANGNWVGVLEADTDQRALRVPAATHLDFERERCGADVGCRFCAPAGGEAFRSVRRLTTAAMLVLSGADPEAERWLAATGDGPGRVIEVR